jgi:hypothetical protein
MILLLEVTGVEFPPITNNMKIPVIFLDQHGMTP